MTEALEDVAVQRQIRDTWLALKMGVIPSQAKDVTRSWKRQGMVLPWSLWGQSSPSETFVFASDADFRLLASRGSISIVVSYQVCGVLLWQLWEANGVRKCKGIEVLCFLTSLKK